MEPEEWSAFFVMVLTLLVALVSLQLTTFQDPSSIRTVAQYVSTLVAIVAGVFVCFNFIGILVS